MDTKTICSKLAAVLLFFVFLNGLHAQDTNRPLTPQEKEFLQTSENALKVQLDGIHEFLTTHGWEMTFQDMPGEDETIGVDVRIAEQPLHYSITRTYSMKGDHPDAPQVMKEMRDYMAAAVENPEQALKKFPEFNFKKSEITIIAEVNPGPDVDHRSLSWWMYSKTGVTIDSVPGRNTRITSLSAIHDEDLANSFHQSALIFGKTKITSNRPEALTVGGPSAWRCELKCFYGKSDHLKMKMLSVTIQADKKYEEQIRTLADPARLKSIQDSFNR